MKAALTWGIALCTAFGAFAQSAPLQSRQISDPATFKWHGPGSVNVSLIAVCSAGKEPVRCWSMNGSLDPKSTDVVARELRLRKRVFDPAEGQARLLLVHTGSGSPVAEADLFRFGGPDQPFSMRIGDLGSPQIYAFFPPGGAKSIEVQARHTVLVQFSELGRKSTIRLLPLRGFQVTSALGAVYCASLGPANPEDVRGAVKATLGPGKLFHFRIIAKNAPPDLAYNVTVELGPRRVRDIDIRGVPRFAPPSWSIDERSLSDRWPRSQLLRITDLGNGKRAFDFISNVDPAYYSDILLWPIRTKPIQFPAIPLQPNQP